MTDRIQSLTVILANDMRDDDARVLASAIGMMNNVLRVELGEPVNINDHFARARIRQELLTKVYDLIKESQ